MDNMNTDHFDNEKNESTEPPGKGSEPECRCKETRGKTIGQVLKMALADLAFWKKMGKKSK